MTDDATTPAPGAWLARRDQGKPAWGLADRADPDRRGSVDRRRRNLVAAICSTSKKMKKRPGMVHNGPNAVTLAPGASTVALWRFTRPGSFEDHSMIDNNRRARAPTWAAATCAALLGTPALAHVELSVSQSAV